jgi:hypothetical protein
MGLARATATSRARRCAALNVGGSIPVNRAVGVDAVGTFAMVGVATTPLGSLRFCPLVA